MRYSTENKTLYVSVREAVATARRGISTYTPHDSEEPTIFDGLLPAGYTMSDKLHLEYDFERDGYTFRMQGASAKVGDGTLHHITVIPTIRDAKKKEVLNIIYSL